MRTKLDLINKAYSRARISGLTVAATPEDNLLALHRLENMAAQWEGQNICTGYNFEDSPTLTAVHNVPRKWWSAYESNLAGLLLTDFGKQPDPSLMMEMRGTFSLLNSQTANPQEVIPPFRQPIGSGNRWSRHQKYYETITTKTKACNLNTLYVGEVENYVEHYDSFVAFGESIASFTIEADTGLTIVSSSLSSPDISYQIKAVGTTGDSYLRVKIVATMSTGRIETRFIQFEVLNADL